MCDILFYIRQREIRCMIKTLSIICLLFISLSFFSTKTFAGLPLLSDLAENQNLPKPYGISSDVLSLEQDYKIDQFSLDLPGFELIDTSTIEIRSKTDYSALKFDAWLLPFLNAFVMLGKINGSTQVALESVEIPTLPARFSNININVDGNVIGTGLTAVVGGDKWFSSLTISYSESDLNGALSSGIETWTVMPRVGTQIDKTDVWLTAMYLDLTEKHKGRIDLGVSTPFGPLAPVNFDLSLEPTDIINYGLGARYNFSDHFNATLEFTFGDREHSFFNLNYRF